MAAVFAIHACKAFMEIAAVQIPINDLLDVGSVESVLLFKPILVEDGMWKVGLCRHLHYEKMAI